MGGKREAVELAIVIFKKLDGAIYDMWNERKIQIQAYYYEEPDTIWCISWEDAYLYKLNLQEGVLEEAAPLLENPDIQHTFNDILPYKDGFIFIPAFYDSVLILNRQDWTYKKVSIPCKNPKIGTSDFKFFTGVVHKDYVYMFGYSYPGLVRISLKDMSINIIDGWLKSGDLRFSEVDGCFHVQYYRNGDLVYFPFMNTNAVMEFDLTTEKTTIHMVGEATMRYISIEWNNGSFWLIPRDGSTGSIVKWNPVSGDTMYYRDYPEGFNYDKYAFYRLVDIGTKILLFAHRANMNISIDVLTGEMSKYDDIYDSSCLSKAKYPHTELQDGKIFFMNEKWCIWWDYVSEEKKCMAYDYGKKIQYRWKREQLNKYFVVQRGMPVRENEKFDLNSLIEYLQL